MTAVNRATAIFNRAARSVDHREWATSTSRSTTGKREAQQAGEEAVVKLKAKAVEPGKYDLVLHPSHLWLTIHESVGHPTELDRSLWMEANYAGTSFLTPTRSESCSSASKIVNFVADRTQPGGLATVGYDDEGVPGQRWHSDQRRRVRRLADDARSRRHVGQRNRTAAITAIVGAASRSRACRTFRCNLAGQHVAGRSDRGC